MFRVSSGYVHVQGIFRVCSEYVQSMFNIEVISSPNASSVSIFGIFNHRIRFRVCLWIITSDIQQRYLNYEVEGQNIGISNILSVTAPFWASPCADRNCIASVTKKGKPWEKMETLEKCSEVLGLAGTRLATRRHCKVIWRQLDGQESTRVRHWISIFLLFRPVFHMSM